MVVLTVFNLFIIFESSKLLSNAVNTYCTLPCPFMCPAQPPRNFGAIQLPPRRSLPIARSSFDDAYADYEDLETSPPPAPPPPITRSRQEQPANPDPPASPPPQPKRKPKPPPEEEPEPPPKKKNSSSSSPPPPLRSSPCIQPSRRFFTSLFSIPGAVVDTLIGGEIVL